jgi:predicted amidohydrolase YtcJ
MYEEMRDADRAGLQLAVHAIGDRAIRAILDMFERLEREDGISERRLRIEHAQHLSPADIPRFAKLHAVASTQPYHAIDDGLRWKIESKARSSPGNSPTSPFCRRTFFTSTLSKYKT